MAASSDLPSRQSSDAVAEFAARALVYLENQGEISTHEGRVTWMFDSTVHLAMPMDRREIQALLDALKESSAHA